MRNGSIHHPSIKILDAYFEKQASYLKNTNWFHTSFCKGTIIIYLVFRFSTSALVTAVAAATASLRLFSVKKMFTGFFLYFWWETKAILLGQRILRKWLGKAFHLQPQIATKTNWHILLFVFRNAIKLVLCSFSLNNVSTENLF